MVSRDDILKSNSLDIDSVDVPEFGGEVFIRIMTGAERDKWEISATASVRSENVNVRAILCAMTICDKNGERLFTDHEAEALGKKSAIALDKIFQASRRLNKLTDQDLQELEKN